jgi:hypothetical protein
VGIAFQLENDPFCKTAEIHYKPVHDVLTPEFQTEHSTIAK